MGIFQLILDEASNQDYFYDDLCEILAAFVTKESNPEDVEVKCFF